MAQKGIRISANKARSSAALRRILQRWHQRMGIASAFFIIVVSLTGVLLNHTSAFGLDKHFISSSFLLRFYSVEVPAIRSFLLGGNTWLSDVGSTLYLDDKPLSACDGDLVAAIAQEEYWLALCSRSIMLFTQDNELIEKLGSAFGLPSPIARAGSCASNNICFESEKVLYLLDTAAMEWQAVEQAEADFIWQKPAALPAHLRDQLKTQATQGLISTEKLVLDIHAGRYLGAFGPLIMDVVALLFIVLAVSGMYMWAKTGKR